MIYNAKVDEIRAWPKDKGGWSVSPKTGDHIKLGEKVSIGEGARIGEWANIGEGASIGAWARIGEDAVIDAWASIAAKETTSNLNEIFRAYYATQPTWIFWKWVTQGRMSPGWGEGTPIKYEKGAVVEAPPEAVISDQQCAPGLHVLRPPYRPEWCGLCNPGHDYICLRVEVKSEDILFAGLPTMDAKVRVRRLKVLD